MTVLWKLVKCTAISNIWRMLTVVDLEERVALVDELMKSGKISFLKEYTARKKEEVAHRGEESENT